MEKARGRERKEGWLEIRGSERGRGRGQKQRGGGGRERKGEKEREEGEREGIEENGDTRD